MKKLIFTIAAILFSLPAFAQNADIQAQVQREVDAYNTMPVEKVIEANQSAKRQIDYISNNYNSKQLKNIVNMDQSMKERIARRKGKEAPQRREIDFNNPNDVKSYLELQLPDNEIDKIQVHE